MTTYYVIDPENILSPKYATSLVDARATAVKMIETKRMEHHGKYDGIAICTSKNASKGGVGYLGEVQRDWYGRYEWITTKAMRGKNSTAGIQYIFKNGKRDTKIPALNGYDLKISGRGVSNKPAFTLYNRGESEAFGYAPTIILARKQAVALIKKRKPTLNHVEIHQNNRPLGTVFWMGKNTFHWNEALGGGHVISYVLNTNGTIGKKTGGI